MPGSRPHARDQAPEGWFLAFFTIINPFFLKKCHGRPRRTVFGHGMGAGCPDGGMLPWMRPEIGPMLQGTDVRLAAECVHQLHLLRHDGSAAAGRLSGAWDVVETSFDDLKNLLDMKRLLIHSSTAMDARLFLQFLALIYISQIHAVLQDDKMRRSLTGRGVMEALETLVQISYSRGYGQLYTETNQVQRKIMDTFGVSAQT
jgi:hypothetical protein